MKYLLVLFLIASEAPVRSSVITAYCDLHWQERYGSWEACYEAHMNNKGPTVMMTLNKSLYKR